MTQPIKGNGKVTRIPKRKPLQSKRKQKYGTSKLEEFFAREYLDKLGLKYVYEYEAKEIGRFYDFAIVLTDQPSCIMESKNGITSIKQNTLTSKISILIECDGDFYHGNMEVMKNMKLNKMQQRNKIVDAIKDRWCAIHHIPLLRIWENDIKNNPKKVFDLLKVYIDEAKRRLCIEETKKVPH